MSSNNDLIPVSALISKDDLIKYALKLLSKRIENAILTSPNQTKDYLCLKLAQKQHEVFCCIYLDNKNQVITFEELFQGTIDQVSVYPREVVRRCIYCNASAVIVAHNHPSSAPRSVLVKCYASNSITGVN